MNCNLYSGISEPGLKLKTFQFLGLHVHAKADAGNWKFGSSPRHKRSWPSPAFTEALRSPLHRSRCTRRVEQYSSGGSDARRGSSHQCRRWSMRCRTAPSWQAGDAAAARAQCSTSVAIMRALHKLERPADFAAGFSGTANGPRSANFQFPGFQFPDEIQCHENWSPFDHPSFRVSSFQDPRG